MKATQNSAPNSPRVSFCPACGAQVQQPDARFCNHCGTPIAPTKKSPVSKPKKRAAKRTGSGKKALLAVLIVLAVLVAAAVCALYICVNYIHIQSGMTGRMDTIKTLEQQLDTLKAENDALETSINTSVDLDYVYKVATEELGMVYANKDQVRLYNKTESEYVRQYEDIPKH